MNEETSFPIMEAPVKAEVPEETAVADMSQVYEELNLMYADEHSDITVCLKTKVLLGDMLKELVEKASADWLLLLQMYPENRKLGLVMQNKQIMDTLADVMAKVQKMCWPKSAEASRVRRKDCLAAMLKTHFDEAMTQVNQAVIIAPMTDAEKLDSGVSLSLALSLRALILTETTRYKAAIEDLKQVIKERIPMDMPTQYYWQLGRCYRGLGNAIKAKSSFEIAKRLVKDDEAMEALLTMDLESLDFNMQPAPPVIKPVIELTGGANTSMPAFSNLVKITEQSSKGRSVVAESLISTGDVLLIDRPYAACLRPEYYGTHCHHCFTRFTNCLESAPKWCTNCSGVAFCGTECRDTAMGTYHAHECHFLSVFTGSGMPFLGLTALRMITQVGLKASLSIHQKYIANIDRNLNDAASKDVEAVFKKIKKCTKKETKNITSEECFVGMEEQILIKQLAEKNLGGKSTDNDSEVKAAEIYSLGTRSKNRGGLDYLQICSMSIFLSECLTQASFFEPVVRKVDKKKAERAISELLVSNIQILQCNAHEIYETLRGKDKVVGSKTIYIGLGIYTTGALLKHDCYPAVNRCQNRHCDGEFYVSNLGFQSVCKYCKTRLDREKVVTALGELAKCHEYYEEGTRLMEDDKFEEAVAVMSHGIDWFHAIARPPHTHTHVVQEALRACVAMRGNVHQVKEPVKYKRKPTED